MHVGNYKGSQNLRVIVKVIMDYDYFGNVIMDYDYFGNVIDYDYIDFSSNVIDYDYDHGRRTMVKCGGVANLRKNREGRTIFSSSHITHFTLTCQITHYVLI